MKNFEDLQLYQAGNRVFNKTATREDVTVAQEAGLIEWYPDVDGYYPSPTSKFLALQAIYLPERYYLKIVDITTGETIFDGYFKEELSLMIKTQELLYEFEDNEFKISIENIF